MQFAKVFLLFLFVFNCCTSSFKNSSLVGIEKNKLTRDQSNGLILYQGDLFTGRSLEKYPNGTLAQEITYLMGKKNGVQKKWFSSGIPSFVAHYKENKREGNVKTWWRNGLIRSSSNYISGVPDGEQVEWYSGGQLFKKINLNLGKEEGLQQAWRENGKLYNNYIAKNGRIFGLKRANLCFEINDEKIRVRN